MSVFYYSAVFPVLTEYLFLFFFFMAYWREVFRSVPCWFKTKRLMCFSLAVKVEIFSLQPWWLITNLVPCSFMYLFIFHVPLNHSWLFDFLFSVCYCCITLQQKGKRVQDNGGPWSGFPGFVQNLAIQEILCPSGELLSSTSSAHPSVGRLLDLSPTSRFTRGSVLGKDAEPNKYITCERVWIKPSKSLEYT